MKNSFSCPNCEAKQKFSKLFLLSNFSKWSCPQCKVVIGPVFMNPIAGLLGFLSTAIPSYLFIFIKKIPFLKGIGMAAIFGLIFYFVTVIFYFFKARLEVK